jgi:hypothetical protein
MTSRATSLRPGFGVASSNLNKLLVSAYKLIGFGLLAAILIGIVSYVGIHGFYLVHKAWVVPTVVSPNDPVVLDLRARIAHEDWMRHKVLADRAALEVQLRKAKRVAELERLYQSQFKRAMKRDAAFRRSTLKELATIRAEQAGIQREVQTSLSAMIAQTQKTLKRDFDAQLIDKEHVTREKFHLAQMALAQATASQSRVDLDEKIRRLSLEVEVFENAGEAARASEPLNYEGLTLQREHENSLIQALGAGDDVEALARGIDEMDQAVVHYDEILNSLEESPMLRATQGKLTLAFIPYDNQDSIGEGAPVYACRLGVVVCSKVGRVLTYFEGELKQAHPVYGRELRGQLAELVLEDPASAKQAVLHVNRPPLWF